MKKAIILIILGTALIIFSFILQQNTYKTITMEEAKTELDKNSEIILIDVRTEDEYQEKHIKNSISIPLDMLEKEIKNKVSDENSIIFVYCKSGTRSKQAAEKLINLGYKNVYNIGGIDDWKYDTE